MFAVNNLITVGLSAPDWSCCVLCVCDRSVFTLLFFLARSSVDESSEGLGDHRGQPAEAIRKLATQGECVHMNQPPSGEFTPLCVGTQLKQITLTP